MYSLRIRVSVDLRGLNRFKHALRDSATRREVLDEVAKIYLAFAQNRFQKYSAGGGNWPPLTPRAMATKQKARRGRRAILIDTLTLNRALSPSPKRKPRGQVRRIRVSNYSVQVGFGGAAKHPTKGKKKKLTIARLAYMHQHGVKNLPRRTIIVMPPSYVIMMMKKVVAERTIRKINNL